MLVSLRSRGASHKDLVGPCWELNRVICLILSPTGVAIRPQPCGLNTIMYWGGQRASWLPRCTPQGTGKLLMWWVGSLWTDVHDGSYLSLVMLHSRKFIGLGPGRPHLTLTECELADRRTALPRLRHD